MARKLKVRRREVGGEVQRSMKNGESCSAENVHQGPPRTRSIIHYTHVLMKRKNIHISGGAQEVQRGNEREWSA